MENRIVIDLNDHASSWLIPFTAKNKDGSIGEEQSTIIIPEGPHREYAVTDSVMYAIPAGMNPDDASHMAHEHRYGFETFFVDSGWMWLYIDGRKCRVETGDIIQLQAGQAHAMAFMEPVKYRGFFHDLNSLDDADIAQELKNRVPEAADDPDFNKIRAERGFDFIMRERPVYREVPVETVLPVKNPKRPYAEYKFEGLTMKVLTTRWENAGVNEMVCAEMEKGFTAEWNRYPLQRELYYVRSGCVRFTVYGTDYTAMGGCVVNIPKFAPHSLAALEKSEVYDMGGKTLWFSFLQDYESIRTYAPERLDKPEEIEALKKKFGCEIKSIGMIKEP
jgi:quercetin dioxygenase-like cupin family protein